MTSELTPTSARSTAASNPFDPEGIAWQRVSSRLVIARQILAAIFLGLPAIGAAVVAVLVTPWVWIGAAVLALVWLWAATVIWRQVRAIGYVEREDDLLLRKGDCSFLRVGLVQRLCSIPVPLGQRAHHLRTRSCEGLGRPEVRRFVTSY